MTMNKILKKVLLLAVALCMALGAVSLAACVAAVDYSVTVTCSDSAVLDGVKVRLELDGDAVEEKALTDGKAEFTLEADTYTVTLTGVPENYTFESATLTEDEPDVTIALTEKPATEVSYTVTVKKYDGTPAAGVEVQAINSADAVKYATTDAQGVAAFNLLPGDYTLKIDSAKNADGSANWPDRCKVDSQKTDTFTVGKEGGNYDFSFLKAEIEYTVNLACRESDVYGKESPASAAGIRVAFYEKEEDETPAASTDTDEDGVATISLLGDEYFVRLLSDVYTLAAPEEGEAHKVTAEKRSLEATAVFRNPKGSSEKNPLTFVLGDNEVPLTNDALEKTGGMGVAYVFVPDETGNYTISATGNAMIIGSDFNPILQGGQSKVFALMEDEPFYFYCIAEGTVGAYKVTIAKGGDISGGDEVEYPWEGEGTFEEPYLLESFAGDYTVVVQENKLLYLSYTPAGDEKYTLSSTDPNIFFSVFSLHEKADDYDSGKDDPIFKGGIDELPEEIELKAGKTYYIEVDPYEYGVKVSFKIEGEGGEDEYPWEGKGTLDEPYLLETFAGDYSFVIKDINSLVYLSYTPKTNEKYTLTCTDENCWLTLYTKSEPVNEYDSALSEICTVGSDHLTKTVELTANTEYVLLVDLFDESSYGARTTFKIETVNEAAEALISASCEYTDGTEAGKFSAAEAE